ncbi:hypothetical protein PMAYCL1PPCAC_05932, partial [Pristionchus mayeri]
QENLLRDAVILIAEFLSPCRTCRLERCLDGGMNPLLILNLENTETNPVVQKFLRIKEDAKKNAIARQPQVIECKIDKVMIDLLLLEDAHDRLRKSSYCPRFMEGLTIDEFYDGPS